MRQTIYMLSAYFIAFLLGFSFIYLIINLFEHFFLLGMAVLGAFLLALVFLLTDRDLIGEAENQA
ncbi:MAG: hypothetical protein AAFO94_22190 [Bacteroidota bacterium]